MRSTLALVLSGGGGERLSVLTAERAVSAVPFGGKYRIIDFVLSNCCHSGLQKVAVLTQFAPTSLHDHIGSGRTWSAKGKTTTANLPPSRVTSSRSNRISSKSRL